MGEVETLLRVTTRNAALQHIPFMKGGERVGTSTSTHQLFRIVPCSPDWEVLSDLRGGLLFPQEIAVTRLRPDIVGKLVCQKVLILVELTVPWEDRLAESHELKMEKYSNLVEEARGKGWTVFCFAVEVGCRGFASKSVSYMLRSLGMSGSSIKKVCVKLGQQAEHCSRWLWLKRNDSWLPFSEVCGETLG